MPRQAGPHLTVDVVAGMSCVEVRAVTIYFLWTMQNLYIPLGYQSVSRRLRKRAQGKLVQCQK